MNCNSLTQLAFVKCEGESINLWNAEESGTYTTDTMLGRTYADELIAHMETCENPTLLGKVAKAMANVGQYGPIEIGFWHRIGERVMFA